MRPRFEICILAGGASSRMGSDKARLRLGRRTMLGIIRAEAQKLGFKVRVIRRDLVERCGPLGGILTGLKTTRAEAVLFLACDMPLVSVEFLREVISSVDAGGAVFVQSKGIGFPLVIRKNLLPIVEEQISNGEFSIHRLCKRLNGLVLEPEPTQAGQLYNVNSPEEVNIVRRTLSARSRET